MVGHFHPYTHSFKGQYRVPPQVAGGIERGKVEITPFIQALTRTVGNLFLKC